MEDLRDYWSELGLSDNATKRMLQSWAPGTQKQYDSALKKYLCFCEKYRIAPLKPESRDIINFLSEVADDGLAFTTISSHRAAISAILSATGNAVAESADISRFMKGFLKEKPSGPKHSQAWDVATLLDNVEHLGPTETLSLKTLTRRLVVLLALCSPKRVSELAALSLDEVTRKADSWNFTLRKTKNRRWGKAHSALYLKFSGNELLCPVSHLEHYVEKTKNLRSDPKLLCSYKAPYKAVTAQTVARWIKEALELAGIFNYSAHSTRAAATSAAKIQGAPIEAILEAANWSKTGNTFERFYHKPVADSEFQVAIMRLGSSNKSTVTVE